MWWEDNYGLHLSTASPIVLEPGVINIRQYHFDCFLFQHKWQMRKRPVNDPFLAKPLDADAKESVALFKLVSVGNKI